jgi:hypothetical protein
MQVLSSYKAPMWQASDHDSIRRLRIKLLRLPYRHDSMLARVIAGDGLLRYVSNEACCYMSISTTNISLQIFLVICQCSSQSAMAGIAVVYSL